MAQVPVGPYVGGALVQVHRTLTIKRVSSDVAIDRIYRNSAH